MYTCGASARVIMRLVGASEAEVIEARQETRALEDLPHARAQPHPALAETHAHNTTTATIRARSQATPN